MDSWVINNDAVANDVVSVNSTSKTDMSVTLNSNFSSGSNFNSVGNHSLQKSLQLLSVEDVKLLNALAAKQLNYGQTNEAIVLLLLCRQNSPKDLQVLRLLARAYIAMKWWDKADEIAKEYDALCASGDESSQLLCALSLLGQEKTSEAQRSFSAFSRNKKRATR
jgi:predicted Zn-dependent protease